MKLDNFPKILWINMDRSPDRREKTQKLLDDHGLVHQRFRAVDGENLAELDAVCLRRNWANRVYACTCSHLTAIKYFVDNMTDDRIVIFEDDVSFDYLKYIPFDWSTLEKNFPKDYKIIQLSLVAAENMTTALSLNQHTDQSGTAAYLITRRAAIELLAKYYDKKHGKFNLLWSKNPFGYIAADYIVYSIGQVYTVPIFTYTAETSTIHEHHLKEQRENRELLMDNWISFRALFPTNDDYFKTFTKAE